MEQQKPFKRYSIALILFYLFMTLTINAQRTATFGSQQNFEADPTYWVRTSMLDETHFIVAYKSASSPSGSAAYLYAVVGVVDTTNKTITYGTPTIIESNPMNRVCVVGISATQAVVAYELDLLTDVSASRVLTISGTSITNVGSATEFSAGDFTTHEAVHLGSGKIVIVYDDLENNAYGTAVIGTVSGNSITFGTPQVFTSIHVDKPSVNAISSSKIIIGYEEDNGYDPGKVIIGDISGTTFSFGSPVTFHSNASADAVREVSVAPLSPGYFVIVYTEDDNSDAGKAIIGTYSGTTVSFPGSPVDFETGYSVVDKDVEQLHDDEFILVWNGSSTSNASKVIIGERDGNSITFGSPITYLATQADDNRVAILSESSFVIAFTDDANTPSDQGDAIVGTLPGLANTWDGSTSTAWGTSSNWGGNAVPTSTDDVTVPASLSTYPTVGTTTSASCKDLTVEPGASLILDSDASNTASLIVNGTFSGTITAKRYMTGASTGWHLTGVPVGGQSIQEFIDNANNSFSTNDTQYGLGVYNEATDTWTTYTSVTYSGAGILTAGQGYETNIQSTGTIEFKGTVNTSQVDIAITRTGNGWNLLGNPYPCSLYGNAPADASNNFLDINAAVIDDAYEALYLWNASTSQYDIVNNSSAATYIPSGQAFFVKSKAGGGTASFTPAMRVHQTGAAFKSGTANPNIILKADNGESTRSTEFRFVEGTTFGLDPGYDAGLFNGKTDEFKLCSRLMQGNEIDFALQCLPTDDFESVIIPIELNSVTSTVEFSVGTSNLPLNIKVYLEDKQDNSFNLLSRAQTYTAQVNIGENADRFYIHTSQQALDQMSELSEKENNIIPQIQSSSLLICGEVLEGTRLSIIDLTGRAVFETNVSSATVSIPSLNNGVYIVKLSNGQTTYSQKINWIK